MSQQTLSADLDVEIDGSDYTLRSSMKAATAISDRFGGFQNAIQAVSASNLSAVQFVLRQGITVRTISTNDLNEAIWREGTRKLMAPAMRFITRLANGGRDPDLEDETDADEEDGEADRGNGEV